jgi:hypothetical protein
MRKALLLLLFVAGGVAFAITVGSKAASASTLPLIQQEQSGTNQNRTRQDASADATTQQANVNLPISILSWGSNGGAVSQSNQADTKAYADNDNGTDQSVDQSQDANVAGSRGTSPDARHGSGSVDQSQDATNGNETNQHGDADASTKQVNVNAPISVLSWGANGGAVSQGNQADTKAYAKNVNTTDQDVDQSQAAKTAADGYGSGAIDQDQAAANDNRTDQSADAKSTTEQKNVNAPLALLAFGGHGSDSGCGCSKPYDTAGVDQANSAKTAAYATNIDATRQDVVQSQDADVTTPPAPGDHGAYGSEPNGPKPCGCDGYHDPKPCICDARDGVTQAQHGVNGNETTQDSDAHATTRQKNVNVPFSFLAWAGGEGDCGCPRAGYGSGHGGGVAQHNGATTTAGSENGNRTRQSLDQAQGALSGRR